MTSSFSLSLSLSSVRRRNLDASFCIVAAGFHVVLDTPICILVHMVFEAAKLFTGVEEVDWRDISFSRSDIDLDLNRRLRDSFSFYCIEFQMLFCCLKFLGFSCLLTVIEFSYIYLDCISTLYSNIGLRLHFFTLNILLFKSCYFKCNNIFSQNIPQFLTLSVE